MNSLFKNYAKPIILASASPRRARILSQIGLDYTITPSHIDEKQHEIAEPENHVLTLSTLKAESVADHVKSGLIIGADTIVVLDNEIMGKPKTHQDAFSMLRRLSGRTHLVYTGFCLLEKPSHKLISGYETTHVHFRPLLDVEIESYIKTNGPMDKAGAYGIQDFSAIFVDRIDGCFYNVVGLPVSKFFTALESFINVKN